MKAAHHFSSLFVPPAAAAEWMVTVKVGIVTFHASHNYGAMLQAYALKKEVERLGCDCRIINYKNDRVVKDYAIFKFKNVGFKPLIRTCMNVFVYRFLKQRWDKFEKFAAEQLNLTERYKTVDEMQKANLDFDALICGSDQVWNPNGRVDAVYMLDFCNNKNIRRISYAPSFGNEVIPKERLEEYRNNIMNIDFLSARETTGANIIKALTERSAKVVVDPVFFCSKSDWDNSFKGMKIKQPYILCYFLALTEGIQKTIDHIKKMTNYQVVLILDGYYSRISADIIIRNAGPEDFISLFSGAAFILTTSFHGTAFSIINRKPFLSLASSNSHVRVTDLLTKINLSERYFSANNTFNDDLLIINYDHVESILNEFIFESKEYLKESLKT